MRDNLEIKRSEVDIDSLDVDDADVNGYWCWDDCAPIAYCQLYTTCDPDPNCYMSCWY